MTVAESTKLGTGRRLDQRRKTLSSEKRVLLTQLKIGKGIKTPNCSGPKGTKARDDERKKANLIGE